jgi:hypothetical protein
MCVDTEKVIICKPEREVTPGNALTGVLLLNFPGSKTLRNKYICKPLTLWYFITGT